MPLTLEQLSDRLDRIELQLNLRPLEPNPGPPFNGHTPASGMHRLKDAWNQWEYIVDQCNWLNDELELAISATLQHAPDRPSRNKTFCLQKRITKHRPLNIPERKLEWDLHNPWGLGGMVLPGQGGGPFGQVRQNAMHNLFQRLVGLQVPLYDNNLKNGWDKIDLVGIGHEGEPVVIELKGPDAEDKPLRVILEGVAYAIALKKVWPHFYVEVAGLMARYGVSIPFNPEPESFHVCLLAPPQIWQAWHGHINGHPLVRTSLQALIDQLAEMGFPLRFGSVDETLNCVPVQFP